VLYLVGQILAFVLVAMVLGAALAWVFLIGPSRRQRRAPDAPADLPTAGGRPAFAPNAAVSDGQDDAPSDPGALAELEADRLGALTERLLRQEERSTVENAELVTRLAAAERLAGESDSRVSAAELQVATAVEQVAAAQDRIAQIEAELRGVTIDVLGRETGRLRTALVEAEARAAEFSARLTTTRTESEEASRQVAAVTERLERRQAEWTAERAALLVRIAEAESAAAAARAAGPDSEPMDPEPMGPEPMASGPDGSTGGGAVQREAALGDGRDLLPATAGPRVVARGGSQGAGRPVSPARQAPSRQRTPVAAMATAGGVPSPAAETDRKDVDAVDPAVLDAVVQEILDDADARVGATAGVAEPPPAAHRVVSAEQVDEIVVPTWGGPAEPMASNDNLKEIVGIGPLIEARLRALGITSFRQLAAMGDTDVDQLSTRLDGFGSRILSDDWVGQARDLQARYHGGLG